MKKVLFWAALLALPISFFSFVVPNTEAEDQPACVYCVQWVNVTDYYNQRNENAVLGNSGVQRQVQISNVFRCPENTIGNKDWSVFKDKEYARVADKKKELEAKFDALIEKRIKDSKYGKMPIVDWEGLSPKNGFNISLYSKNSEYKDLCK